MRPTASRFPVPGSLFPVPRRMALMDVTPIALLELQVRTLFRFDAYDRMLALNEPGGTQAPRFFLGRTAAGNIWRLRHDLPRDLAKELETLAGREPLPYALDDPPLQTYAITHALRRHNAITHTYRGPAYAFLGDIPAVDGVVERLAEDAELLHPDLVTLAPELGPRQPCFAVVVDGCAVSVCYSARIGPLAAEAGVQTVQGYRGRGFATRVTAAWAAAIRAKGLMPLYSTTWENAASRQVAKHLGLTLYAEDWHLG